MLFSTLDSQVHRNPQSDLSSSTPSRSRRLLKAVFVGALAAAAPLLAAPDLLVTGADGETGAVAVGDDLFVTADGLEPGAAFRFVLVDESGTVIAEHEAASEADGSLTPEAPLWARTGVIGCDPGEIADPLAYRFERFESAEAILDGRSFEVRLVDGADGSVRSIASVALERDSGRRHVYFADGAGCPRTMFYRNESLYLAGENFGTGGVELTFFLVDGISPPSVGDKLIDVRPEYSAAPQQITVPSGQSSFLALIWDSASSVPGDYGGVLREGFDPTPRLLETDGWIGAWREELLNRGPHGISITPWDCPTCDDPNNDDDDTGQGGGT